MSRSLDSIRALLIAEDPTLTRPALAVLERYGVQVTSERGSPEGLLQVALEPPDVVLLEARLGGLGALSMCRTLRERCDVPIVVVSEQNDETDRVLSLEAGADDYVALPFSSRELLARVRAHVRRARGLAGPDASELVVGGLRIDRARLTATLDGSPLALTGLEFTLLRVLAESASQVVSREQLVLRAGGRIDDVFERSIDVHVSRLRKKLGDDPRAPRLLKTIRGQGYSLVRA